MRVFRFLSVVLLAILLAGCAAQRAYDDGRSLYDSGKVEEGLSQLETAYQLDPGNPEYRSQYFKRRDIAVYQFLSLAETAKKNGAWDDAENYYLRVLKIDPSNTRARTGLSSIGNDRKHAELLADARELVAKNDLIGASKKVRAVLAEAPSDPDARKLQKAIEGKAASSNQASSALKSKLIRPITIEFKDAPMQAVFDSISSVAGINFIFDKEVRPDLRINLAVRDARIQDVIRFVLVTNQLGQRMLNGNTLFIYPNTPQKQRDYQELQVRNFYLTNAVAKDVANMLKGMVKTRDIFVDDKLNLIVMRDTPDVIQVAERLIAAHDIAEPEVMLEVEVLEVGTNLLENIGIQYPNQLSYSLLGAGGVPGSATLAELHNRNMGMVRVSITDPALVINLLHQDGDTNLLANPRIRVKNREKANIHIGDKVPVLTSTATATGLLSQSVNYLDVGLKLDVEPTVYLDDDVAIKVGLEVSSITKQIQTPNAGLVYQIGTRNASTVLRLKDGETQILAGLIDKEDRRTANSIPVLGQLPMLGRLFSSRSDTASKTEVVLLITPHVVRNVVPPESPVEAFSSGTESIIGLEQLEINQAEAQLPEGATAEKKGEVAAPGVPEPEHVAKVKGTPEAPPLPPLGNVKLMLEAPPQAAAAKPFTVKVNLVAGGVQAAMLNLAFDPASLKVVSVDEGDLLKKPDGKTQFMQQVQDKAGRVSLSVTRQGNAQGEGTLASVTFQPLPGASGATQVRVEAVNFSDAAGRVLPVDSLPQVSISIVK